MAINVAAGGRVYQVQVLDIPREFLGHDLVSGLRALKTLKT